MTMSNERIILGIDPGTSVTGFGIVQKNGSKIKVLNLGIIDLRKISDPYLKLKKIFKDVTAIIDEYKVTGFAVEAPFFGKNVQSMLKLGKSQGVAIAAALSKDIDVTEYSPRKIKQAVTGNGNASKEQVATFLESILNEKIEVATLDATDALAVAVCHATGKAIITGSSAKSNSWKAFINKNPKRVL